MSEFSGIIITDDHEEIINSFSPPPVSFCANSQPVADEYLSPLPVVNQGGTSSCAGHAGAALASDESWESTGEPAWCSPWFCYIESQRVGGFLGSDQGTSISSVLKSLTEKGCCLEPLCKTTGRYYTNLSAEAYADANQHKHLGATNIDLRKWDDLIAWITDKRGICIGTPWFGNQSNCDGMETDSIARGGRFLGFHAREIYGWKTVNGVILPRVRNSHGTSYGDKGFSLMTQAGWEAHCRDANTFALGFTKFQEHTPKRQDWSQADLLGSRTGSLV